MSLPSMPRRRTRTVPTGRKWVAPAASATALAIAALAIGAAPGVAHPLPPGCNIGYGGQSDTAFVGKAQSFAFTGYNAVPPGHHATDVQISWGDGTTTRGTAKTATKPFSTGCYTTTFSARHVYTRATCRPPAACGAARRVTVRYRDAKTGARHSLTMLQVSVLSLSK
jgi:hypothetical protein